MVFNDANDGISSKVRRLNVAENPLNFSGISFGIIWKIDGSEEAVFLLRTKPLVVFLGLSSVPHPFFLQLRLL